MLYQGTEAQPPTVFYVEDHAINVLLMRALFEHRPGLRLEVATTGQEALQMIPALRPALLMLDLQLPDCHGSGLLLGLRQHAHCRDLPAVAVTADVDFDIAGTSFLELWAKPLHLGHVLQRLDALTAAASGHGPWLRRERSTPGRPPPADALSGRVRSQPLAGAAASARY